jgi:hypothetical protein
MSPDAADGSSIALAFPAMTAEGNMADFYVRFLGNEPPFQAFR